MLKLYRLICSIILLLITYFGFAQSLTLSPVPTQICRGTSVSVTLTSTGNFGLANTISLQLALDYSSVPYSTIPFSQSGNVLAFQWPAGSSGLDGRTHRIRAVSSDPVVESNWSNDIAPFSPASVTLLEATPVVVNAYQTSILRFQLTGSIPIQATLSDSTSILFSDSPYGNTTTKPFTVTASGQYSLVNARNLCGAGTASGSVNLQVNSVSMRTLLVTPLVVCRGDTLYVSYSKNSGLFGPTNQFRLKLSNSAYPPKSYTLPASESNGVLKAVIPENVEDANWGNRYFYVSILTSDPVIETPNPLMFEIRPKSTAEIVSNSVSLPYGSQYYPIVRFRGAGPFMATLSNGTTIGAADATETTSSVGLKPGQSTLYRIERFVSACTNNMIIASSAMVVINPGIWLDTIPSFRDVLCEGQTMRIHYAMNVPTTSDTRFMVTLRENAGSGGWTSSPIQARIEPGNWLVFEIPSLQPNASADSHSYVIKVNSYAPDLATLDVDYWNTQTVTINRKPEYARFNYISPQSLNAPGEVGISLSMNGGGYYSFVLTDGVRYTNSYLTTYGYAEAYVGKTTTFSLVSASNGCGTITPTNVTAIVTVQNPSPNQIYLKPIQQYVCHTDSTTVEFTTEGTFLPGNEFRVQAVSSSLGGGNIWTNATLVGRGTGNSARFKLPYSMRIRVVSTNPVTVSEGIIASVTPKLNARIMPFFDDYNLFMYNGTPTRTLLPGEPATLPIEVNAASETGSYSLTYTDGTKNYSFRTSSWNAPQTVTLTKTTTFSLVAVRNECGLGTISGKATFTVVPFRLKTVLPNGYNSNWGTIYTVCGGGTVRVPFLTDLPAPVGTAFTLQIASAADSVFRDLVQGQTSPLTAQIPASFTAGNYLMRVVVKGTEITTIFLQTRINQLPVAIMRLPTSGTVLNPGDSFRPTVTLTGTSPWEVQFSDNAIGTYYYSPATPEFRVTKATTYFVRTVTNVCGYGSVSGEASVSVRPSLSVQRQDYNNDCAGTTMQILYNAFGDFEPGNELLIELTNEAGVMQRILARPASASGVFRYTIPTDLQPGIYRVFLRSTNPVLSSASSIYIRVSVPPIVSLTGSTTINAGQTTNITLRNERPIPYSEYVTVQLASGPTSSLYFNNNDPVPIAVSPTQTTTYSIVSASGNCGLGQGRGAATVVVNPTNLRTVQTGNLSFNRYCPGATMTISFVTTGNFSVDNQFRAQLIDSTGGIVHTFSTFATQSPLSVTLPALLPGGWSYRVRVIATDNSTSAAANLVPFGIIGSATVAFSANALVRPDGQEAAISLMFGGSGPWSYSLTANGQLITGSSSTGSYGLLSNLPAQEFTLTQVSNQCGPGTVLYPAMVRVYIGMKTLKNGDWNDLSVWSGNRLPTAADALLLRHQVRIPSAYTSQAGQLIYEKGATLTFGSGSRLTR